MVGVLLLSLALQVAPANPGVIRFYSSAGDATFETDVSQAALDAAPKWTDGAEVPLSPNKAAEAARTHFATWVNDAADWRVESITLRSVGSERNWIYVVQFWAPRPANRARIENIAPGVFQVVVLLNGIAIEPRRVPSQGR